MTNGRSEIRDRLLQFAGAIAKVNGEEKLADFSPGHEKELSRGTLKLAGDEKAPFFCLMVFLSMFAAATQLLQSRNSSSLSQRMARLRLALIFLGLAAWGLTSGTVDAVSFSTVVIDPGHGGFDRGGIRSNIIPEKGVALDVARRLRNYLDDAGFRTVMTRSSDTFVTLDQRVGRANAQRRAIFVSIHFNSAPRRGANGIETFYASARARQLASLIQRYAMKTTSGENRGIKRARFYVLRRSRIPAVLIECGFLTNPQDARRASRAAWRDQLARQIARAIIRYRRS
jgi:N-acetylmuramoyl-L-alanine amidase